MAAKVCVHCAIAGRKTPATHAGAIGPVCCSCFQLEFEHCANVRSIAIPPLLDNRRKENAAPAAAVADPGPPGEPAEPI